MRVLFLAEVASIHSVRWIQAATEAGVEAAIFQPTYAPTAINAAFDFFTGIVFCPTNLSGPKSVRQVPFVPSDKFYAEFSETNKYPYEYAAHLLEAIRQFRPDLIHVLGICVNMNNQTRCLNTARLKSKLPFPPVAYSSWGTDLDYYFPNFPEEQKSIELFLKQTSYYISECKRDVRLAQQDGFRGQFQGFFPANGGFDTEAVPRPPADQKRPLIMLKGRDQADGDVIGRAMTILDSFALCADAVRPFKIQIVQAQKAKNIQQKALELSQRYHLDIEILPFLSEKELFAKLSQSYLYISMTINDGLPISLVEALALGAFPIFSNLESLRDYIESGKNGFLTPWDQPAVLAEVIRGAIDNPDFVKDARDFNYALVDEKLSKTSVSPRLRKIYRLMTWKFSLVNFILKCGRKTKRIFAF